jgi:hypothetical protein
MFAQMSPQQLSSEPARCGPRQHFLENQSLFSPSRRVMDNRFQIYLIRITFIPPTIPGHGMLLSKNYPDEIANVHQEMVPATQSKQDDNELSGRSWLYGVHFALA